MEPQPPNAVDHPVARGPDFAAALRRPGAGSGWPDAPPLRFGLSPEQPGTPRATTALAGRGVSPSVVEVIAELAVEQPVETPTQDRSASLSFDVDA